MSDNIISNNPKATVAAITTGLESLSLLIPNQTVQKIFLIISPAVSLIGIFIFHNLHKYIESKRGLRTYEKIIADLEKDLLNPNITDKEKRELQTEIINCKAEIRNIRIKGIKIIVEK